MQYPEERDHPINLKIFVIKKLTETQMKKRVNKQIKTIEEDINFHK